MRVTIALVSGRLKRALQPRDGSVHFAFLQKVGADIVVGISEAGIDFDGLPAFLDRIVDASQKTIRPTQKRVCLGGGKGFNRFLVEIDGFF